jgi:hypothetical protein
MNQSGGLLQTSPVDDPVFAMVNGRRDRDRKVVGKFLIEELRKSHTYVIARYELSYPLESLVENMSDHFPWGNWCEFAYKHKVTLVGWSRHVFPPGPGFNHKSTVCTDGWKDLAGRIPTRWRDNPLRDDTLPELGIVRWSEGMLNICFYVWIARLR